MHKILAVDDDEFSLKLLEKYLVPAGYAISKARNGAQALEMIEREHFDLIITDVSMPRIGGFRLLEEVNRRHRIPAIVVTASDIDSETQRKTYSVGALSFMVKPLDRGEVLAAVKNILEKVKV